MNAELRQNKMQDANSDKLPILKLFIGVNKWVSETVNICIIRKFFLKLWIELQMRKLELLALFETHSVLRLYVVYLLLWRYISLPTWDVYLKVNVRTISVHWFWINVQTNQIELRKKVTRKLISDKLCGSCLC
jgi:hypothetical protein